MSTQIRQPKYKVGDTVRTGYSINGVRTDYPGLSTVKEVVYDLDKHTPDTHMYVVTGGSAGFWFESELVEVTK